eukprot:15019322-Alexandrium_andersonii.AAC.1
MSASLVGSEMCIRDREGGDHVGRRHPQEGEGQPEDQRGPQLPQGLRGGPVSYTHLTLPTICSV